MILKVTLALSGALVLTLAVFYAWATSGSYPRENYTDILTYSADSADVDGSASEGKPLTLVSYNIGYLSGLTNQEAVARPKTLFDDNLAAVIATLRAINPDIIAYQEIDLNSKRSYNVNQLEALANALGLANAGLAINWNKNYVPFPYWPISAHFGKIVSGQAVLSRYPITENQRTVLEKVASRPFFYNAVYLDRLAQVTKIDINNRPLVVINVHLEAFDNPTRFQQTRTVRGIAETYAKDYPVLVVGDFNSAINRPEEGDRSIEIMAESALFTTALAKDQWTNQPTFPSESPEHKLDYLFYTPATIELKDTRVVAEIGTASDHLPLMMTFTLK
ncbi:endonuclease/exonuclease/phosphatase family protein [Leptothoe sp. PORK10 BA2]|uniref:endonuclease/exonuclease/phosphatase family protein n=1 Tax=Leptothoe sp. PORK10 BA2 TaxID=3110254 RepID=UPI002B203916|nr:endonuclease/exonuclease/phosphatase family protein [Leptothoe sp. PORK10 BA2]MEA5462742.1 endonuclease/exonuclease/phosphatase family protein [Leptothoe sp. PORK10 BA2]